MLSVITLPREVWSIIILFLIPIEGMQLLRVARQFRFLGLERPILNNFKFHFAKFLPDYVYGGDRLLAFVRSMSLGHMGNPRVLFSGSLVLQGLRHECYAGKIGLDIFCHLRTLSIVVGHLTSKQGMTLLRMDTREELADKGYSDIVNDIDSWWSFLSYRGASPVNLFVARDHVPLRDLILRFDLDVVQNYYDGSSLFCACPRAVFAKRMHRSDGGWMYSDRALKYVARGYSFDCSHVTHHPSDRMLIAW